MAASSTPRHHLWRCGRRRDLLGLPCLARACTPASSGHPPAALPSEVRQAQTSGGLPCLAGACTAASSGNLQLCSMQAPAAWLALAVAMRSMANASYEACSPAVPTADDCMGQEPSRTWLTRPRGAQAGQWSAPGGPPAREGAPAPGGPARSPRRLPPAPSAGACQCLQRRHSPHCCESRMSGADVTDAAAYRFPPLSM